MSAVCFLVTTVIAVGLDPWQSRRSWRHGFLFPGLISLGIMGGSLANLETPPSSLALTVFLYSWLALGMLFSHLALVVERRGWRGFSRVLLFTSGYGPLLCAVTLGAYVKEFQGASLTWEKTEKTGKVA